MKLPLDACTSNQKEEDGHRKEDDGTEQKIAYDPGDDWQCHQADEVHNGVRQGRPSWIGLQGEEKQPPEGVMVFAGLLQRA